jgi:hypothetical protein
MLIGRGDICNIVRGGDGCTEASFYLIKLRGGWCWRLDSNNDDGLIGPFMSRDEAEEDARETWDYGMVKGDAPRGIGQ